MTEIWSADVSEIEDYLFVSLNAVLLDSCPDNNTRVTSDWCPPTTSLANRQKSEILVDMSESPVIDRSFQSKLSSSITRSFSEKNGPTSDSMEWAPSVIVHYSPEPESGGDGCMTSSTGPSAMAACLTAQQASNERLRKSALQSSMQSVNADAVKQGKRLPYLAELARCQKLKRVLDIHSETIRIEQEILKIWSSEAVNDPLKVFTRRRSMEILEQSTQTLTEISNDPSTTGHQLLSPSADGPSTTLSHDEGLLIELTIHYAYEAVARILRTLVDLGSTMQEDTTTILSEFDAIGKRRESSIATSPTLRNPPRMINYSAAIDLLLAAMPTNYNIEVLKAIGSRKIVGVVV